MFAFRAILWYNALRIMNTTMKYTTMTTTNHESYQKPPIPECCLPDLKQGTQSKINHQFSAMNLFFLFFPQKAVHSFCEKMQNKPNLNISKNTLSASLEMTYLPLDTWYDGKNKPNSNPIQTHSKPIQTHFKPIFERNKPSSKTKNRMFCFFSKKR